MLLVRNHFLSAKVSLKQILSVPAAHNKKHNVEKKILDKGIHHRLHPESTLQDDIMSINVGGFFEKHVSSI